MKKPETIPCPFCGCTALSFYMNQGYKWGQAECADCGAKGPEVRTKHDWSDDAPWHKDAIEAWNKRTQI